ncbi:MAG: hypothetical protein H6Q70_3342 [Firmicutes bacterium]|nr:hypothetical protein [Bacillota bacterium]
MTDSAYWLKEIVLGNIHLKTLGDNDDIHLSLPLQNRAYTLYFASVQRRESL